MTLLFTLEKNYIREVDSPVPYSQSSQSLVLQKKHAYSSSLILLMKKEKEKPSHVLVRKKNLI
jgi:hypothetical protein